MKTKDRDAKKTGANADGGAIEKGQSRGARKRAGTTKPNELESLDETERDSPDRQFTRDEITES